MQADSGTVRFNGNKVDGPLERLVPGHPGIAYLSQHFELRNHYRVEEVLEYANNLSASEAANLYAVCQIDHLLRRWTNELSGGERQRIALARLLTSAPGLLLLDEPFSNLDLAHRDILRTVIRELSDKLGISCIMASHDPADILSWADNIIVLHKGYELQRGTPQEIYCQPYNEYVAGLFGRYTMVNDTMKKAFPALRQSQQQFLRPEQLVLTTPSAQSLKGTATRVDYLGSHSEVIVNAGNTILTVHAPNDRVAAGDTVYLDLRK